METVFNSRVLGLDYGEKRIGVDISDPLRITAQPLRTIQYHSDEKLWFELDRIIHDHEIERIVIGLPINMNGSIGKSYHKVELFAEKLKTRYQLEIDFWDERLTSLTAEKTLRDFNLVKEHSKVLIPNSFILLDSSPSSGTTSIGLNFSLLRYLINR